jgi:hypothetical protein
MISSFETECLGYARNEQNDSQPSNQAQHRLLRSIAKMQTQIIRKLGTSSNWNCKTSSSHWLTYALKVKYEIRHCVQWLRMSSKEWNGSPCFMLVSSETSVNFHRTTRCYNPEDAILPLWELQIQQRVKYLLFHTLPNLISECDNVLIRILGFSPLSYSNLT